MNEIALEKLRKYCAYQDRCHQEVRTKLLSLQVYGEELEEVMSQLIAEDFLNEERFARSFARGKFRIKHWGKIKIVNALKRKYISDYCIRKALLEIDDIEYQSTIQSLIKKNKRYEQLSMPTEKRKLIKSLQLKGFEYEAIIRELNNV